ncbi:hypothetical protein C455_06656 [Haloferax larsenii JCM 13917]|nr:hypothetical protein [Haloferax larsenii]ELZ80531.1 hypothetical protein C455_06656 [Haloferax larsenii JCM 13917]
MGETVETNSLEVRWFGTGPPPTALSTWLSELGPADTESNDAARRTDLYFPPFDPTFNLKLRGGDADAVEVKYRLGSGTRHTFGPDVTGTVEQWYKWSFPLDYAPDLWSTDRTGLWLPVEKTRLLHPFEQSVLRSLDPRLSETGATAHVEVTEVTARSTTGWTCCVEAAGEPADLEDVVDALGDALFGESFPVELGEDQSLGYVEWLRQLSADVSSNAGVRPPSKR